MADSFTMPANQVAIADRGYHSIYSGLNLDGWNASDEGKWAANDWVLSYAGETDRAGQLTSSESVKQIGFVVDVRLTDASSRAVISAGPGISIDLRAEPFASLLEPDGRWNRIEAWTTDRGPVDALHAQWLRAVERSRNWES